mmetsp:Transcript_4800/g.15555  ORF Transcript_4800/g.15555 Transcript_4800/m.15555 type:complete len:83 (-) Transcript_4800:70-318(-)
MGPGMGMGPGGASGMSVQQAFGGYGGAPQQMAYATMPAGGAPFGGGMQYASMAPQGAGMPFGAAPAPAAQQFDPNDPFAGLS